jgi:hypothetical protein
MFEWAQRLAQAVDFELLSDARSLNVFVSDVIELYHNRVRGRHRELFRFGSWDDLAHHYRGRGVVERIGGMLRNGYGHKDWLRTSAKLMKHASTGYALGLIEDVRNREFPAVMLAPDIVDWVAESRDVARPASAVYVAVTRAQRRLLIPRSLRNWIDEISKS